MSQYIAINKAADSIESDPKSYNFHSILIPGCGTPGCALGWVAAHTEGFEPFRGAIDGQFGTGDSWVCDEESLVGCLTPEFYSRMGTLTPGWTGDPLTCAMGLRLYAEKYYGHEKPTLPQSVLDIFTEERVADPDRIIDETV